MAENHQAARFHPPIRYTVRFPDPRTHYLSVEACLPAGDTAELELFLPVWTPGSYLVREYARNIEDIAVSDPFGAPLAFQKSSKNRWRVQTGGAAEILFAYRVYCREMSVRTNWVEDSFALVNGAPTFVTVAEFAAHPHKLRIELPLHWQSTVTGLPEVSCDEPHHYVAESYDELVDSPILCGNPGLYRFDVNGISHVLAIQGDSAVWDGQRATADAEKLVRRHCELWGSLPYSKYAFLNLLTEAGGGLEHRNSVCLMASRWAMRTRRGYLGWLNLVSHEFFHVWNAKRLRPVELGPFDYERENYTRCLWVVEGITDYYAPLTVRRAGLSSPEEYLAALSETINTLQSTPGRLGQSLEQASWDAWIKLYRPDENSGNTTISYYTKGAVVAWLLDARIRRVSGGGKSLDDLMRAAFERFSGDRGFTPEQFKALAGQVAGENAASENTSNPFSEFFRQTVESVEELDYTEALDWFGLRFKQPETSATGAVFGAVTRVDGGRLLVTRVPRQTAAWHSGLNVDDEIIAIDQYRVRPDQLAQRLENYRPGDRVSLLLARRDELMRLNLTFGEEPRRWHLEARPDATEVQKRNLANWLGL